MNANITFPLHSTLSMFDCNCHWVLFNFNFIHVAIFCCCCCKLLLLFSHFRVANAYAFIFLYCRQCGKSDFRFIVYLFLTTTLSHSHTHTSHHSFPFTIHSFIHFAYRYANKLYIHFFSMRTISAFNLLRCFRIDVFFLSSFIRYNN